MSDKAFLMWLHARLADQHGENINTDFMHKLRSIADVLPEAQNTPVMLRGTIHPVEINGTLSRSFNREIK